MKHKSALFIIVIFGLLLGACSASSADDTINPNKPVSSNDTPIPVEPDGGIGGVGDTGKVRGNAYVNDAQLNIMESYPVQVSVSISGDLPTPCNELRYAIDQPDANNRIYVEVYSVVDPEMMCTQVLQPFSENIPLPIEDLPDGIYKVFVNDEKVGEFSFPG